MIMGQAQHPDHKPIRIDGKKGINGISEDRLAT
jgi:hypothetical protein